MSQRTRLIIPATLLVFALVANFLISAPPQVQAEDGSQYADLLQDRTAEGFPILGSPAAPITLVEFSNFSCPGCLGYKPSVTTFIEDYVRTGKARLLFMPMIFGEDPSLTAAMGALCADRQDGFWDMHDALFAIHETQGANAFTPELVTATATTLGLDADALGTCLAGRETRGIVQQALIRANTIGVEFTPTLMYSLDGGYTLEWFTRPESSTGETFNSSVPPEVVAEIVSQAAASQLTPAPTLTPTPQAVPPFGFSTYKAWTSPDELLTIEYPETWEVKAFPQNGPLGYGVAVTGNDTLGVSLLGLPLWELNLDGQPQTATPEEILNGIFGSAAANNLRTVTYGGFKGAGFTADVNGTNPATGEASAYTRDIVLLALDDQHYLIVQSFSLKTDWERMAGVADRVAASIKVSDVAKVIALLDSSFPAPMPPAPTPTPIAGFTPVKVGEGKCVGVKVPEGTEIIDGKDKKFNVIPAMTLNPDKVYCAIITTEKGAIVLQLYPEVAPLHVNSFIFLAREGFYNGITWHRVIPDFMAQTGDPTGTGSGGPGYLIPLEMNPAARYDRVGVLGMARTNDPNSAGSQFFITYVVTDFLNPSAQSAGYSIFGQLVEGEDVLKAITPRDPSQGANFEGDKLVSIVIVEVDK